MREELPGWEHFEFQHNDISHAVFVNGSGAGIVLMHELPGMTPPCVALAERLVAAGYRVFMPLLFGRPLKNTILRNTMRMCISREIWLFRTRRTSPIVDWLRSLCRKAWDECGGQGVGVIGMCLTGNFAITLLAEESVLAPVACQPTLPFGFAASARELAMLPEDLESVKTAATILVSRCSVSVLRMTASAGRGNSKESRRNWGRNSMPIHFLAPAIAYSPTISSMKISTQRSKPWTRRCTS